MKDTGTAWHGPPSGSASPALRSRQPGRTCTAKDSREHSGWWEDDPHQLVARLHMHMELRIRAEELQAGAAPQQLRFLAVGTGQVQLHGHSALAELRAQRALEEGENVLGQQVLLQVLRLGKALAAAGAAAVELGAGDEEVAHHMPLELGLLRETQPAMGTNHLHALGDVALQVIPEALKVRQSCVALITEEDSRRSSWRWSQLLGVGGLRATPLVAAQIGGQILLVSSLGFPLGTPQILLDFGQLQGQAGTEGAGSGQAIKVLVVGVWAAQPVQVRAPHVLEETGYVAELHGAIFAAQLEALLLRGGLGWR